MKTELSTLLDFQRLALLAAAVQATREFPGDVVEFGTFQGGSAALLLGLMSRKKMLHVFDTFEGMPEASADDNYHRKGDFANTGTERVRAGLAEIGDNFKMHVGLFSDTMPELAKDVSLEFCLAHIDADLYESIHQAMAFCYPRMIKGGIMIFDDYGAPTCEGAKKAVDEFFEDKVERIVELSQPSHGCIVGGGNAFEILSNNYGFPLSLPTEGSDKADK